MSSTDKYWPPLTMMWAECWERVVNAPPGLHVLRRNKTIPYGMAEPGQFFVGKQLHSTARDRLQLRAMYAEYLRTHGGNSVVDR